MPEPFRLELLRALTLRLKEIPEIADGVDEYGRPQPHVYRGRDLFGENDPLPIVSILEDPQEPQQMDSRAPHSRHQHDFNLIIQGFVADDSEHPTDPAYYLSAKIVEKLAQVKRERNNILGFGCKLPCVTNMTIGIPVVRPADNEVSSTAFFYLSLSLQVVEDAEKPFVNTSVLA